MRCIYNILCNKKKQIGKGFSTFKIIQNLKSPENVPPNSVHVKNPSLIPVLNAKPQNPKTPKPRERL